MNFGQALEALKAAQRFIVKAGAARVCILLWSQELRFARLSLITMGMRGETFPVLDAIYIKTTDDKLVPWQASQTDILAEDWLAESVTQ